MTDARQTALRILNRLNQEGKTLDHILLEIAQDVDTLSRRDRALLNTMVYGVLRWRGRLDHIIAYFSHIPIQKIQPTILSILRLGLFQMVFLDRIPNSAAVNTSVELAKQSASQRASGFVNALLRKAASEANHVPFPTFQKDPLAFLTSGLSMPPWLAKRWLKRFSPETLLQLCQAINTIPAITLRTNTLKTDRQQLLQSLDSQVAHLKPASYAPDGIHIMHPKQPIHHLAAYPKGWFQVQDEAAQLVTLLLNPQPGETVLDACAGFGGKTAHMAQLMLNQGTITAVDNNAIKLQQLAADMQRLGISIVNTRCHDLQTPLAQHQDEGFDRVLVDAPCSGLGVMRRNPDIKWNSSLAHLKRHADIQKHILKHVATMVRPNGILVYAVCSMEPEENEAVIDAFLKKHPDFVIDKRWGNLPKAMRSRKRGAAGFRTLAFINHMDGFFLARLKRRK